MIFAHFSRAIAFIALGKSRERALFLRSIIQKSEVILYMHILIHLSPANSFKIAVTLFFPTAKHKQDTRCKLRKHVLYIDLIVKRFETETEIETGK